MKKIKLLLLSLIACTAVACKFQFTDDDDAEQQQQDDFVPDETMAPDTSVSGSLNIRLWKKGYGDLWLNNVVKSFKAKYPNVNAKISTSTEAKVVYGEIVGNIEDKYDLYITEANVMDYRNIFVNLDDTYEATAIDEDVKLKDKIEESYFQSCSDENGHFYTMPAYCGAYGFAYNREYIKDSDIPVTTDQLLALANKLKSEQSITPFVFSGGDQSIYLSFLYASFAAQYEGKEAYLKAQVGRVWNEEAHAYKTDVSSAFLPGHLKAGKVLEDMYWQPNNNASNQCVGYSANDAQKKLLTPGNSPAMMFVPSVLMTEMATFIKEFETDPNNYGMFKAPIISAIREKCPSIENDDELAALVKAIDAGKNAISGEGYSVTERDFEHVKEARNFVYVGSEGSRFVITQKAKNAALAKLFMRFYYSKWGINALNSAKAGNYVPIKVSTVDTTGYNAFLKDVYQILAKSEKFFNLPAAFQAVSPNIHKEGDTYEKRFGSSNGEDRKTAQQMYNEKMEAWTANSNAKYKTEMGRYGYSLDD